jgi:hypothetical protein
MKETIDGPSFNHRTCSALLGDRHQVSSKIRFSKTALNLSRIL